MIVIMIMKWKREHNHADEEINKSEMKYKIEKEEVADSTFRR